MPEHVVHYVSDEKLLEIAQEAIAGGEELAPALALIRREMGYRGLTLVAPDNTGVYDAVDGTPDAPKHDDVKWQTDFPR